MLRIAQSSQRLTIVTQGQGLEPQLEFTKTLLEFGPILPHSDGDEVDVIVKNPCSFPIEFYSLEFDKQYLQEEKVSKISNSFNFFCLVFSSCCNFIAQLITVQLLFMLLLTLGRII